MRISKRPITAAIATTLIALTLWLAYHAIYVIKPNQTAVLWHRLEGTQLNASYAPGVHLIAPWNKLYKYPSNPQIVELQLDALSQNGDRVSVSITVRYQLIKAKLPLLHKDIGPDFSNLILLPEVEATLRTLMGKHSKEALLQSNQAPLLTQARQALANARTANYIEIKQLSIKQFTAQPAPPTNKATNPEKS